MSINFDSSLFVCAESNVIHGWYWKSAMLLFVIESLYNILVRKYSLIYIIFVQSLFLIQTPMYIEDPLYTNIQGGARKISPPSVLHVSLLLY